MGGNEHHIYLPLCKYVCTLTIHIFKMQMKTVTVAAVLIITGCSTCCGYCTNCCTFTSDSVGIFVCMKIFVGSFSDVSCNINCLHSIVKLKCSHVAIVFSFDSAPTTTFKKWITINQIKMHF